MRLFEGTEFDIPPRCERCKELEKDCQCPTEPDPIKPPEKQTAKIVVEKRKRGKLMTVIRGLDPTGDHLKDLLTKLKSHCGAGGTIQDSQIEIQGNHRERVMGWLSNAGYKTK